MEHHENIVFKGPAGKGKLFGAWHREAKPLVKATALAFRRQESRLRHPSSDGMKHLPLPIDSLPVP